jgi:hypothetical protein
MDCTVIGPQRDDFWKIKEGNGHAAVYEYAMKSALDLAG